MANVGSSVEEPIAPRAGPLARTIHEPTQRRAPQCIPRALRALSGPRSVHSNVSSCGALTLVPLWETRIPLELSYGNTSSVRMRSATV